MNRQNLIVLIFCVSLFIPSCKKSCDSTEYGPNSKVKSKEDCGCYFGAYGNNCSQTYRDDLIGSYDASGTKSCPTGGVNATVPSGSALFISPIVSKTDYSQVKVSLFSALNITGSVSEKDKIVITKQKTEDDFEYEGSGILSNDILTLNITEKDLNTGYICNYTLICNKKP
jgi:hypothetical protein